MILLSEIIKILTLMSSSMIASLRTHHPDHCECCADNGIELISSMIHRYSSGKPQRRDGVTPLHWAALHGNIQASEYLIDNGAMIDEYDNFGNTCLHYACRSGNLKLVEMLLKKGAGLYPTGFKDITPLHIAAEHGFHKIVRLLLNHGLNPNAKDSDCGRTPMHYAAYKGNIKSIAELIQFGGIVEIKDDEGNTPLHFAAANGRVKCVDFLIEHGASVITKDDKGNIPLCFAVINNHKDTTEKLIKRKSDVNNKEYTSGVTPLYYAWEKRNIPISEVLIRNGASLDNHYQSLTLLQHSALAGEDKFTELYLRNGSYPNEKDFTREGLSALHYASQNGNVECCKTLLKHGANVNIASNIGKGKTPLEFAEENNHEECYKLLKAYGGISTEIFHKKY